MPDPPVRVVQLISRLNIGGSAAQAIALTAELEQLGYETRLLRGAESPREGSMDQLAEVMGVRPLRIPHLGREVGAGDVPALLAISRVLRRFRPHILHTHAAKAGTLGRAAVRLPGVPRPAVVVHTYHGHSLRGYWSHRRNSAFVRIERALGARTDRLIAVSEEVCDELVEMGVAPRSRFEVVPVGFDLSHFITSDDERERRRAKLRGEWGIRESERLVTLIARLVPIKRVDRFLRIAVRLGEDPALRFAIVGDGELRDQLRASEEARTIADRLVWTGFRHDIADICFASDVLTLTSDNEGTPVSLIEAHAAGTPVVATRVGGTPSVVSDGSTGLLADPDDEEGLAEAVRLVLADPARAAAMGSAGRVAALERFSLQQLVRRVDRLYRDMLAGARR